MLSPRSVVGHQLDPRHAGRRSLNSALDERSTEATLHEPGLVLGRGPDFGHDQVSVLIEPRRVDLQPVGPVAGAGHRVDAEQRVHRVVLLRRHTFEFEDQLCGHVIPPKLDEAWESP